MSHRSVVLKNNHGDLKRGVEHPPRKSDEPGTITADSTTWYITTWHAHGWDVVPNSTGEWEE
jgi:hypothetical protein